MRPLYALIKREFTAYFLSPVAYVTLAVFLLVTGHLFYLVLTGLTKPGSSGIEYPMQALLGDEKFWLVFLFIPPLLTMRLLAEERGTGTLESLLTSPIRDWQVVAGKFIGACLFYVVLWLPTLAYIPLLTDLTIVSVELAIGFVTLAVVVVLLLSITILTDSGWSKLSAVAVVSIAGIGIIGALLGPEFGWVRAGLITGGWLLGLLVATCICVLLGWAFGSSIGLGSVFLNGLMLLSSAGAFGVAVYLTTLDNAPVIVTFGIDPYPVLTSYLGVMLAGGMFLGIGLFVSSLVKSQLVSAMISMVVSLVFVLAAFWRPDLDTGSLTYRLVYFISVPEHFRHDFTRGVIDTRHLILYGSVTLFTLFLTVRSLESRRLRA